MKGYKKLKEFYLGESDYRLMKHILPQLWIGKNINDIEIGYAARFMQNELNSVLGSFVNGGFSNLGYAMYPLAKCVSKSSIDRLERLERVAAFLNKNGYDFSGSIRYKEKVGNKNFADALSALYNDFSMVKSRNTELIAKPECKELDMKMYRKSDLGFLKPLEEFKKYSNDRLKKYLLGFYIHGSLATMDYVKGWSDVDTLAIVSAETIGSGKRILELRDLMYRMRAFFYKIDPLQHHGSIVISEHDLGNYCQAYFPVPIFRYAKSFFAEDRISRLRARTYKSEALGRLFWLVSYFRKMEIERKFRLGSYELKNLLHSITLFPSIYLQAKGVLAYKKFSFGIAKKDFKDERWKVIKNVESIRARWRGIKVMPFARYSRANPLLCYRLNSVFMDLLRNLGHANDIDTKRIIEGMLELSEEAWQKAVKNAREI